MNSDSFHNEDIYYDSDEEETDSKTSKEEEGIKNLDLIKSISFILTAILKENKKSKNYKNIILKQRKNIFSSKSIPNISIYDYLVRIQKYACIEKSTLIMSLIYIDRLCDLNNLTLTHYNLHKILFTAVLISIKYNEDSLYNNNFYAKIAGVKLKELKDMEYSFVEMSKFKFFISNELFEKYNNFLNHFKKN